MAGEQWKDIKCYEGKYQISNYGNIKSIARKVYHSKGHVIVNERIIKQSISNSGYLLVTLSDRKLTTYTVHRLVGTAFILNPDHKATINHKDGNKTNNYYENLEWATHSENLKHCYAIGLRLMNGENHNQSIISDSDVIAIRFINKTKLINQIELSDLFGTVQSNISKIANYKRR